MTTANRDLAMEIMRAVVSTEREVRMDGGDFVRQNWLITLHPSTWYTILRDVNGMQYVSPAEGTQDVANATGQALFGVPVATTVDMLRGAFEIRWSRLYMLPMDGSGR